MSDIPDPASRFDDPPMRYSAEPAISPAARRLSWALIALTTLLLLRFLVPYLLEETQYAITRGRQRAEYDAAGKAFESLNLEQISRAYQLVSQRVAPSVVSIDVVSIVENDRADDLASLFGPRLRESQGQGSGVIVDTAGFILTNNHVVANATEIQVGLADGRIVPASIVGVDPLTDLAVLKITGERLTPAEWGDSDALSVGALVWAVGSPFGLQHSITAGIISGKNRQGITGSVYEDFLQTDAAVNPGNSGGPLVDARGRIVGINTAIYGEAYQGISFSIPAKEAREVYERLKSAGRVRRGWLGVVLEDLDAAAAERLRLKTDHGVLVVQVAPNTPADRSGLLPGDVILLWDGHEVASKTVLSRLIARTEIGTAAEAVLMRRGVEVKLSVTVGERPSP